MSKTICRKAQSLFGPLHSPIQFPRRSLHNGSITRHTQSRCLSSGRAIPKIADTSLWASMVPKFLRRSEWRKSRDGAVEKTKERNPTIFFLVMFTLIGSQSIRMISLKNDHDNYVRSSDAKLRLLKEVIERLQKGEDVDVKKLLGTGNEASEREWEEVLAEIERDDVGWKSHSRKNQNEDSTPTTNSAIKSTETAVPAEDKKLKIESTPKGSGRFY